MKSDPNSPVDMVEIELPFSGFYNSVWSDIVDNWIEREIEYSAESESESEFKELPPEFEFDYERALSDAYSDAMDYSAAYIEIAKLYAESFWEWICEQAEIPKNESQIAFVEMVSPREYNFETDRIFVSVNSRAMRRLHIIARKDPDVLQKTIESRHLSRSGFMSYYSARKDEWFKSIADMDYIERKTILIAAMESFEEFDDMDIYYDISENDYHICSDAMNYDELREKFDNARDEAITNQFAIEIESGDIEFIAKWLPELSESARLEWMNDNPEYKPAIESAINAAYRCIKTLEMEF